MYLFKTFLSHLISSDPIARKDAALVQLSSHIPVTAFNIFKAALLSPSCGKNKIWQVTSIAH